MKSIGQIKFGIKTRLLLTFLLLTVVVVVSGALSVYNARRMRREVQAALVENGNVAKYCQALLGMQEAGEHALSQCMVDKSVAYEEFERSFMRCQAEFPRCGALAGARTFDARQAALLDSIGRACDEYARTVLMLLKMGKCSSESYHLLVEPLDMKVRWGVRTLLGMYSDGTPRTMGVVDSIHGRVLRVGVMVVVVGIILSLVLVYLVVTFYIAPILSMRDATEAYLRYRDRVPVKLIAHDELEELWHGVGRLMESCDDREGRHRGV